MKVKWIQDKIEAKALMYFLAHEMERHIKDLRGIAKDMYKLQDKWEVEIPNHVDPDEWIEP